MLEWVSSGPLTAEITQLNWGYSIKIMDGIYEVMFGDGCWAWTLRGARRKAERILARETLRRQRQANPIIIRGPSGDQA